MVFPLNHHFPMVFPWFSHGFPKVFPRFSHFPMVFPMVFPHIFRSLPAGITNPQPLTDLRDLTARHVAEAL